MSELAAAIEVVLFTAHGPVALDELLALLEVDSQELILATAELEAALTATGLRLSRHDEGLRLVTAPEHGGVVTKALAQSGRSDLTKPVLETLSIIAYRGPISRADIEAIRGVNSEVTIRNLLGRELIKLAPKQSNGAPRYVVSTEFLDHFGLTSTAELPPVGEIASEEHAA